MKRFARLGRGYLSGVYATLGQIDRAFEWLDVALEERSDWLTHLDVEPCLRPLHSDPRFSVLREKVGLAAYRERPPANATPLPA